MAPAPLASLEDVKRVLRVTSTDETRDDQLRAALRAVDSWIRPQLRGLSEAGPQIEVFYDVYEDATLHLPSADATVTAVRCFYSPALADAAPFWELALGTGYDLNDQGDIMLRPFMYVEPFEGAWASRSLKLYQRVEVHYISTGVIPAHITEGVAMITAGYWQEGPALLNSISREKIGDYEYWTSAATEGNAPAYMERAMKFLNSATPKARVSVT